MGLFDFLFGKKEPPIVQKQTEQSKPVNNITTSRVLANKQKVNASIVDVASSLNMAYTMGSPMQAEPLCRELYAMVGPRRLGGKALLQLSDKDCQCVGMAFVKIAIGYNWGDIDINSVAAENAFYCLARNLTATGNTFVAPAIFSILYQAPQLLREKLISSKCSFLEKKTGTPIGLIFGMRNPYRDPSLEEFRQDAIKDKDSIMYYALSQFYDIEERKYLIPTDLPYFIPTEQTVISFLSRVEMKGSKQQFVEEGKMHMMSVYKECEETLMKF